MAKQITLSKVNYNVTLLELFNRFPELKTAVEKQVNKFEKKPYERIIVGLVYSSRDSFPRSLSVKIECFDGKNPKPYTYAMHFTCKWIES